MPAKKETLVRVDGQQLTLTNLDKVLYPATGTTKRDTIEYLIIWTSTRVVCLRVEALPSGIPLWERGSWSASGGERRRPRPSRVENIGSQATS